MRGRAAALAGSFVALAAALLAPAAAHACAVCTGQDPVAVTRAMLKGTALLSLTPLAMFGTVVWYVRRRARQIAAAEAACAEAGANEERAAAPSARAV